MPGSKKTKFIIALALTLAASAPALAGMNGTESMNRIQAAKRAQSTPPEWQAQAAWQGVDPAATSSTRSQSQATKPYPHHYYGGPRSFH